MVEIARAERPCSWDTAPGCPEGSRPKRRGMRSRHLDDFATPSSGSPISTKWKSLCSPFCSGSGICPRLIQWALTTIRLSAACRKTSVNRATGSLPDAMMSASTCPGPTDGNWSTSPTSSRAACSGTARVGAFSTSRSRRRPAGRSRGRCPRFERTRRAWGRFPGGDGWSWPRCPSARSCAWRPAGRRRQQDTNALGDQDAQDRVERAGLADAGTAGHHDMLEDRTRRTASR